MRRKISNPTLYDFVLDWKEMFLDHLDIKDCKEATIKKFSRKIDFFVDFLSLPQNERIRVEDFDYKHINSFLKYTKDRILKERSKRVVVNSKRSAKKQEVVSHWTLKSYITALKSFFNYISDNNQELLDFSSVFKKAVKIKENTEIDRFSLAERQRIEAILEQETQKVLKSKSESKIRSMFAINILFYTGLRAFEVLNIKLDDFDSYDEKFYSIEVKGKGGKIRRTFLSKKIADKFLKVIDDDGFIYPVQYLAFYNRVNCFLAKCKIDHKKSGCHIFRHSFGDYLVSQGVDLKIIQELLGHNNITTTSKFYTRASDEVKVLVLDRVL